MLKGAPRFADDVTKLELDKLKMRIDPPANGRLQSAEQLIGSHRGIDCLRASHPGIPPVRLLTKV